MTLISGRVDWTPREDDRAFVRLQDDFGQNTFYLDPISPVFDAFYNQSVWQGNIIETHTFSSSAASQFLLAGLYYNINALENPSEALAALPAAFVIWKATRKRLLLPTRWPRFTPGSAKTTKRWSP
jgi:hypothetical protein